MGGLLQYYIFSSLRADLSAWQSIIKQQMNIFAMESLNYERLWIASLFAR